MSYISYLQAACGAILGTLGITVDVYPGEQPGMVIVEIGGLSPEVSREKIVKALDVLKYDYMVTVKFVRNTKSKIECGTEQSNEHES